MNPYPQHAYPGGPQHPQQQFQGAYHPGGPQHPQQFQGAYHPGGPQYPQQQFQGGAYPPQYGGQAHGGLGKPHAAHPYPMAPPVVVHIGNPAGAGAGDVGAESKYIDDADKLVRLGFIRKVYGILSLQLSVTLALVLAFAYSSVLRNYVAAHPAILIVSIVLTFVFLFALSCFPSVARTYPTNYLCLAGFTLCQSLLVGTIASTYSPDTVVKAVVATGAITLGLTLFAFQTRIECVAPR
jgi:hypothetical protein